MEAFFNWLSMGGYSAYVWSAYGVVGITFLGSFVMMKLHKKRVKKQLQHWFKN